MFLRLPLHQIYSINNQFASQNALPKNEFQSIPETPTRKGRFSDKTTLWGRMMVLMGGIEQLLCDITHSKHSDHTRPHIPLFTHHLIDI